MNILSMFADALSLFIENKKQMWEEVQRTIQKFKQCTGLKVNNEKTMVNRLGSTCFSDVKFYSERKLLWSEGDIELLGMTIMDSFDMMLATNLAPVQDKAKLVLNRW